MSQRPDIFDHLPRLGETAVIVGPGIKGTEHYQRIEAQTVVTLNKAILIPKLKQIDYWMVWAGTYPKNKHADPTKWSGWWPAAMKKAVDEGIIRLFGHKVSKNEPCEFSFAHNSQFYEEPAGQFVKGILRPGCTIAGGALQFCYWCDVKHVLFVGCDFYGQQYYDGSKNPNIDKRESFNDSAEGPLVDTMNTMIEICQAKGMVVESLSETKLNLKVI